MNNPNTQEQDILELNADMTAEQTENSAETNEEVLLHIDEIASKEEDEMQNIGVIEKAA